MPLTEEQICFIDESNRIENIHRPCNQKEMDAFEAFMDLPTIIIRDLENFVNAYQPGAKLRDREGMDVYVGDHMPPEGGSHIPRELEILLQDMDIHTPFENHKRYEILHPFMDGNGRSGRMLWMWQMRKAPLGFLHTWYYQSLDGGRHV